ncbi:MAG: hypothetical protein H0V07_12230 [Propionibacteriales bacterium]|nr:hypothetical protein [Propionibacteriales bacterium]
MLKTALAIGGLVSMGLTASMAPSATGLGPRGLTVREVRVEACVSGSDSTNSSRLIAGQQRLSPAAGVVVVGGSGMRAKLTTTKAGVRALTVRAADDVHTAAMAERYAANGRSVVEDARAAGVPPGLLRKLCIEQVDGAAATSSTASTSSTAAPTSSVRNAAMMSGSGTIFDSICLSDSSDSVQWGGCVTRYRATADSDPNWNYGIDDSQASGHETACCWWNDLHAGGVKNSYDTSRIDITKASPGSDINDLNQCYNSTFGLSVGGFGATTGGTVCPDRWNIARPSMSAVPEYHKVQWEGETNNDRESVAMSGYRVKPGYSSQYSITIYWDVH